MLVGYQLELGRMEKKEDRALVNSQMGQKRLKRDEDRALVGIQMGPRKNSGVQSIGGLSDRARQGRKEGAECRWVDSWCWKIWMVWVAASQAGWTRKCRTMLGIKIRPEGEEKKRRQRKTYSPILRFVPVVILPHRNSPFLSISQTLI